MEQYACQYVMDQKNKITRINCTDEGIIQIKDIFDMIAGSSMGGVIAAALVCPADQQGTEAFQASQILETYKTQAQEIYKVQNMNYGLATIVIIISTSIGAFFGLKKGNSKYQNSDMLKVIHQYNKIIKEYKEELEVVKNLKEPATPTDWLTPAITQSDGPNQGYVPPQLGGIGSIQDPPRNDI